MAEITKNIAEEAKKAPKATSAPNAPASKAASSWRAAPVAARHDRRAAMTGAVEGW